MASIPTLPVETIVSRGQFNMWACSDELRPVAPTPDVVGLGVLVAFAGSAGIAIVALLLQYLFFYRPQADVRHVLDADEPWAVAQRPNPIDALLLWRLRGALWRIGIRCGDMRTPERESGFRPVLERSILSVADVQLGMGLALLIYGYTSLASGISAYSWWNIVGLVWFAVITNLAAQSYLRKYYLENPGQRQWRLWLLVTMIAALVVSMVPTVRMKRSLTDDVANPHELLTTRALCYFPFPGRSFDFIEDDRDTAYSSGYVLVLAALIIVSVALLRQYEKPGSLLHGWRDMYRGDMQRPLVGDQIDCIRCEHRFLLLAVRPYMSFWLVLRLYADLANSILTEIACSIMLLAWVTIRYADIRKIDPGLNTEWSLTQILALVIFAAPLKALADFACRLMIDRAARPRVRFVRATLPKFSVFDWMRTSRKTENKGKDPEVLQDGRRDEEENERQQEDQDQIEDDASDITQLLVTPATSFPETPLTRARTQSVGSSALWPDPSVADSLIAPSEAELEGIEEEEQQREYEEEQRENDEALACEDFFLGLQGQFYFQTTWLPIGLQVLVFATVLHMVLLFALPRMVEMAPSRVLAHTGAWYLLYQPLLLFVFLLASMVVEERSQPSERARSAYLALGAAAALLSAGAVIDTIFGLGGTPMSYVALSALGLALLTYVLYGFVARPGRLAKGKDRSYMGEGDVEEQRSLLYSPAPTQQNSIQQGMPPGSSPIRPFAVRRAIRYHGPARRPGAPKMQFRSKYGRTYGTML